MKQVMIDTNIFDSLITDTFFPDVWQALESGKFKIITTPVQEQEIAKIKEERERKLIQSIPRWVIPLANSDSEDSNDFKIGHTAAACCDILVTEDNKLRAWFQSHYPQHTCYNYQQFIAWVLQIL